MTSLIEIFTVCRKSYSSREVFDLVSTWLLILISVVVSPIIGQCVEIALVLEYLWWILHVVFHDPLSRNHH